MSTLFLTFLVLLCSGGIPLLIPLAALNFSLMFWIDKWLRTLPGLTHTKNTRHSHSRSAADTVLRFYSKPPYQNQALAMMALRLMPYVQGCGGVGRLLSYFAPA